MKISKDKDIQRWRYKKIKISKDKDIKRWRYQKILVHNKSKQQIYLLSVIYYDRRKISQEIFVRFKTYRNIGDWSNKSNFYKSLTWIWKCRWWWWHRWEEQWSSTAPCVGTPFNLNSFVSYFCVSVNRQIRWFGLKIKLTCPIQLQVNIYSCSHGNDLVSLIVNVNVSSVQFKKFHHMHHFNLFPCMVTGHCHKCCVTLQQCALPCSTKREMTQMRMAHK